MASCTSTNAPSSSAFGRECNGSCVSARVKALKPQKICSAMDRSSVLQRSSIYSAKKTASTLLTFVIILSKVVLVDFCCIVNFRSCDPRQRRSKASRRKSRTIQHERVPPTDRSHPKAQHLHFQPSQSISLKFRRGQRHCSKLRTTNSQKLSKHLKMT